ncbi:IS21 family transposase [Sulfurimonas sp. SWIR-19]|uniref:IS21 family transposase n=1 Tax=Sulfurimonas sp. SWIR-19 TaxID=2878390 RepID=UPI001CF198A4|nr:IS21 family transposase [Sulfurimonas sp. SWIR-19]UCN00153.1 IS21 family transposase [Sulfurimonas sp. SWIR-19]
MIKKLLEEGLNKTEVARRLGISRETVRKYSKLPDGYVPIINRTPVENIVDPFLPHIAKMLETAKEENSYIPTTVIYAEIQKRGYKGSLRWLQQVMQKYELRERIKNDEKLIRFETEPAKQMQVDWVEFPKEKLSAFVATMGYSRASYVEYVDNEKIETLLACHMNAFRYFGGVPLECLYDNMRTVIIKRNVYGRGKHKLNPLFEDFAKHCGFTIRVCRPYRPKTKGKVERFNHYFRYSFHNALKVRLAMMHYELNLENANAEVLKWLENVANIRIHQTTLQRPFDLLAEEQPHLLCLPKPYGGIHPKVIIKSVAKKESYFNRDNCKIDSLYIPNRDMQTYDDLIPAAMFLSLLPALTTPMQIGGALWH